MGRDQADRRSLTLLPLRLAVRFPALLLRRRNALAGCSAQHPFLAWGCGFRLARFIGRRTGGPAAKLLGDMVYPLLYFIALPFQMGQGIAEYVSVPGVSCIFGSGHNYS